MRCFQVLYTKTLQEAEWDDCSHVIDEETEADSLIGSRLDSGTSSDSKSSALSEVPSPHSEGTH